MRRGFFAITMAALLMLLCACAASPKTVYSQTPAPLPSATPLAENNPQETDETPDGSVLPHIPAAYRTRFTADFYSLLEVDLSDVPIADNYQQVILNIGDYDKEAAVLYECVTRSALYAAWDIERTSGMRVNIETNIDFPDWKYFGAFVFLSDSLFISRNTASKTLKNSILSDVSMELNDEDDTMDIVLNVKLDSFERLIDMLSSQTGMGTIRGVLSYAYLLTAYDDEGNEKAYELPEPEGNLLNGITAPLERMRLRDTWYASRDGGQRKHVGTDIPAAEDTPIYSCTSGVILYIGHDDIAGNFVAIRDDYGYLYFYMHMVRLPDFIHKGEAVNEGDVIGHVGNTGNSDTNHLHISIISDKGIFINPYPYLAAA